MSKSALITASTLAKQLATNGSNIKILDATWSPDKGFDLEGYKRAHIPGSNIFDHDKFRDNQSKLRLAIPNEFSFNRAVSDLGISNNDHIVLYDTLGIFSCPRAWWLFRLYGHQNVSILDGGLQEWIEGKNQIETGDAPQVSSSNYSGKFHKELYYTMDDMKSLIKSKEKQYIDARPPAMFKGSPDAAKSGHIPGAINIPFSLMSEQKDNIKYLKGTTDIEPVFSSKNIDITKPLVISCGSGLTACIVALGAYQCGNSDAAVYTGSWGEWSSFPENPIEK